VNATSGNVFEVLNPATGDVITEVADASEVKLIQIEFKFDVFLF